MNVGNQGGAKPNVPSKALATRPGRNAPAIPTATQISSTRCKVCNSPYRREIDMCLVTGWSQTEVMRHFNQVMGEDFFNKMNMSRHARYHLDAKDAAVRRIIEKRAQQFIGDVDAIEGSIMTKAGAMEIIIQRGIEQINAGVMELRGQDILTAITQLDKMESEWKETAIDELINEFKAFAQVVKDRYGDDEFRELWTEFEAKIDNKARPALIPIEAESPKKGEIEGELVEEEDEDA